MTRPPIRDPRRLGGSIAGPGGPHDRDAVVVDTHDAVLLDGVNVALVEPYREGRSGSPMLAMVLRGRINKSSDRAEILWLFDEDGAAGVITELLALASRIGPGFAARIVERIDELKSNGALG